MSYLIRTDVTAVKLLDNLIFAGIGGNVYVYEKDSGLLINKIKALCGQKIHGFVLAPNRKELLVFGGKQFNIILYHSPVSSNMCIKNTRPIMGMDWVYSAIWPEMNNVSMLTAHNTVLQWDIKKAEVFREHKNTNNSILYSGLLHQLDDGILVLAGTAFSQILIHTDQSPKLLHALEGHRGVIFSISYEPQKEVIVSTSDDRSVRLWSLRNIKNCPINTVDYWQNVEITCKYEVYGHTARVMRNHITNNSVVSIGEDSVICFWDFEGNLLHKSPDLRCGPIWCVDADDEHIVTGGSDSAVLLHPLSVATEECEHDTLDIDEHSPKKLVFTARNNIVVLCENNVLIHFNVATKYKTIVKLDHKSTYKMLAISHCKQIIAVADMTGCLDVFIENCKDTGHLSIFSKLVSTKVHLGKLLSMHWADNRYLLFCSERGTVSLITAQALDPVIHHGLVLPPCKERWLTAVAYDNVRSILILGDRCGNIHFYSNGSSNPVKTFNKVHGRYGPTSITIKNCGFSTTGRDGTVKFFSFEDHATKCQFFCSKDLDFQWVEKYINKNGNLICGFRERDFIVFDIATNSKVLEVPCGGGHRSWDVIHVITKVEEKVQEYIKLIYVKNSSVQITAYPLNKIMTRHIVNGSHTKEINCLKILRNEDTGDRFYISGGEDTTLRISRETNNYFKDEHIFKQLSSIRTLRVIPLDDKRHVLFSAGGRAQICVKIIEVCKTEVVCQEVIDFLVKGTDKERKGGQTWRNCSLDFDPETRIMDIDAINMEKNKFLVFTGCSDACLRVFEFTYSENSTFSHIIDLKFHDTCILKTHCLKYFDKDIVLTCCTSGLILFWDVTRKSRADFDKIEPFHEINCGIAGLNCISTWVLPDKRILIGTGGDANTIYLILVEFLDSDNLLSLREVDSWSSSSLHSSQITGLVIFDNIVITCAIDQRISTFEWDVHEGNGLHCEFVAQEICDIADIQGMDVVEVKGRKALVCVYGKGVEVTAIATV